MLPENRRQQLDEIVAKMVANKEDDSTIEFVVEDFKKKYSQQEVQAPEKKLGGIEKVGSIVNKIFPGEELGKGISNSIRGFKALATGDQKTFEQAADENKRNMGKILGDTVSAAALPASLAVNPTGGALKSAAQLGALGAISGGAGAAKGGGDAKDIFKSAMVSGVLGAGISLATSGAGKIISGLTKKAPAKIYNTTVNTPLQDTKKAIMYRGETLGEQMVKRGVTGNDEKLFKHAVQQVEKNEDSLQSILSKSKQVLSRNEIEPYLDDLIKTKEATPGLASDVDQIRSVLREFPDQIPLAEANKIKRNLYNALDDVAFKIDPSLSTKKEAMKAIARGIKTEIEKKTASEVGEGVVQGINQELQVFGSLKKRSLDKIARANKNNLLGLGDMFGIGAGAAVAAASGGSALVGGVLGEVVKRAGQSTGVMTRLAVGLNRVGKLIDKLPVDNAGRISKAALLQIINNVSQNQNKNR